MMDRIVCVLIGRASQKRTDMVLNAAMKRKRELFPDWDIVYMALPKNSPEERVKLLQRILETELGGLDKDTCF